MIERDKLIKIVAKAICCCYEKGGKCKLEHNCVAYTFSSVAQAAIDAIYSAGLEWPTEEMVKARWSPEEWDAGVPEARVPEWRTMWRASPLAPKEDGK